MKKIALFCVTIAIATVSAESVWRDVAVYYSGNATNDANGVLDPSSIKNIRFAAIPDAATHGVTLGSTWAPAKKTVHVRKENVVCACAGKTLENEDVFYFEQPSVIRESDGKSVVTNQSFCLPLPDMTNTYTALIRYRLDAEQPRPTLAYLLSMGYSFSNSRGLILSYNVQDNLLKGTWGKASALTFEEGFTATNAANPSVTECWTELALIVSTDTSKSTVKIGLCQPNSRMRWTTKSASWFGNGLIPYSEPRVASYVNSNYASTENNHSPARGSFHMIAIWKRALTENEVKEAFSSPAPSLWRLGGEAYGHEMFAGSPGAEVEATQQGQARFPASMASGSSVAISFTVPSNLAGMAQVLRAVPAASSANGVFLVELDGSPVGRLTCPSRSDGLLFVPGERLTPGAHRMTLTRSDNGAEPVCLDELELVGSWRIGRADNSSGEFAGDGGDLSHYTTCGDTHSMHSQISSGVAWRRITVYHSLPESLTSRCSFEFAFKPSWIMGDSDIIIPLKMNGSDTPWKTWSFTDKTEQTASFWPGELRPGENAFAITSEQNGFVYDYMDIRLTGLAAGLTIIFR